LAENWWGGSLEPVPVFFFHFFYLYMYVKAQIQWGGSGALAPSSGRII